MRKSRFTEAQIIGMIKEQEGGLPTIDSTLLSESFAAVSGLGSTADVLSERSV